MPIIILVIQIYKTIKLITSLFYFLQSLAQMILFREH